MDKNDKIGIIYIATNNINGKKYVGQTTVSLKNRIKQHLKNKKRKPYFMLALNKYGVENFSFETFEFPKNELNEKEKYFIKELNTMSDGYNLKPGGTGEYDHNPSEESRFKMGHNRGKQFSEEHKNKISESHLKLNFNHTDETKKKISLKKKENDHLKGIKQSNNHKTKRIDSLKKSISTTLFLDKKVLFIDPFGNEYIEEHSIVQFCKNNGLCRRNVSYVLSGKYKKHKGWIAKYI